MSCSVKHHISMVFLEQTSNWFTCASQSQGKNIPIWKYLKHFFDVFKCNKSTFCGDQLPAKPQKTFINCKSSLCWVFYWYFLLFQMNFEYESKGSDGIHQIWALDLKYIDKKYQPYKVWLLFFLTVKNRLKLTFSQS